MKFGGLRRLTPWSPGSGPAEATVFSIQGWEVGRPEASPHSVMILPQVHLRNGFGCESVNFPPAFLPGPDHILSNPPGEVTHYHLACEQHPWRPEAL